MGDPVIGLAITVGILFVAVDAGRAASSRPNEPGRGLAERFAPAVG